VHYHAGVYLDPGLGNGAVYGLLVAKIRIATYQIPLGLWADHESGLQHA
jgi:hypothetical protein